MRRDATVFEKTNVKEEQLKFSVWGADSAESNVRFSLSRSEVRKGPTKGTACCRECAGPPGFDSILFTLPPTFSPHTLPGNWFLYLIWCSASFHVKSYSANFLKGKGSLWRDTGREHLPAVSLKRYRSSLFVTSDSHCAPYSWVNLCNHHLVGAQISIRSRVSVAVFSFVSSCVAGEQAQQVVFHDKLLLMISDISNVPCSALVHVDFINFAVVLPLP